MVRGAGFGRLPVIQACIGLIDLLMPEKTHARSVRSCGSICRLLELLRRQVTQRRMQTRAIVVLVDERFNVRPQVIKIPIVVRDKSLPALAF